MYFGENSTVINLQCLIQVSTLGCTVTDQHNILYQLNNLWSDRVLTSIRTLFNNSLPSSSNAAHKWPPWYKLISLFKCITFCWYLKDNIIFIGFQLCFGNVSVFNSLLYQSVCSVSSFIRPALSFAQYVNCKIYSTMYLFVWVLACAQGEFV